MPTPPGHIRKEVPRGDEQEEMLPVGIFGSFSKANKVINDAKKDVKRPKKDEVAAKRQQKQQSGKK